MSLPLSSQHLFLSSVLKASFSDQNTSGKKAPRDVTPSFSVRRGKPELVAPAKETPRELKPVSDIDDQAGLRFHVPITLVYGGHPDTNSMGGKDPARVFKEALAAALVYYYPLAGRLFEEPDQKKLVVDCTGEIGVVFTEADADITLEALGDDIVSHPTLDEFLCCNDLPHGVDGYLGCPMVSFQVPQGYYGNAIVYPAETTTVESLCKSSLSHTVGMVKKLKAQVSKEYVRSVADLMVIKGRPSHTMAAQFILSDNRGIGFEQVDFGWGYPLYCGAASAINFISFFTKFKNRKREDGVAVSIALDEPAMKKLDKELKKLIDQ